MGKSKAAGGSKTVIARLLAAFIPGFIFINSLGIFLILALPIDRMQMIPWVMTLAFLFYTFLIMWIFHVPSPKRVWTILLAGIAVTSIGNAAIVLLGNGA